MPCILDGVTNLDVNPKQDVYSDGDLINCSADGNPTPSFQWVSHYGDINEVMTYGMYKQVCMVQMR